MPTENRSSNTEMVSVPRELIEFAVGFKSHGYKNLTEQDSDRRHARGKLRAILDQPADHSEQSLDMVSEQRQGEPVADKFGSISTAMLDTCNTALGSALKQIDTLRAQLAELVDLHGGELGLPKEGWPAYHKRKMDSLRDLTAGHYERKLAERDALLRDFVQASKEYFPEELFPPQHPKLMARYAALSASAEPEPKS